MRFAAPPIGSYLLKGLLLWDPVVHLTANNFPQAAAMCLAATVGALCTEPGLGGAERAMQGGLQAVNRSRRHQARRRLGQHDQEGLV